MAKFLNKYEIVTYEKLRAVADKEGAHVFSKVRLCDVVPVNNSGISKDQFSFALKAHVDFLVTDSNQIPQFCVEFDGPLHRESVQIERDKTKNFLFAKFSMPYIRINARYLENKYRGLDLLTYFVDVWFLALAFDKAQASGFIPPEESFDPCFILSNGQPDSQKWPFWLSLDPQLALKKLYNSKRIVQAYPSYWIGEDYNKNLRCIAWNFITNTECVFIETGMRKHLFPSVCQSELLSQLAVFDLYDSVHASLNEKTNLKSTSDFMARLKHYTNSYKLFSLATCGFPTELNGEILKRSID